jgi:type II secretory ATPase GspE/PulE/Tfp pilus assembly ATPase PilB-like protein
MKERTPRVDQAELLRRTFDFDVFACVRCGGRRRVCGGTGYSGRIVLAEYWEPDEQGRHALERGLEPSALRRAAMDSGFRPLVAHAARLAAEGLTSLEELRTVVPYAQILRQLEPGTSVLSPASAPHSGTRDG